MILLFGNVGSGKGTQAELLAKKYGVKTLSSGEILRAHQDDPAIKDVMAKGKLVGDDILLPIMESEIAKAGSDKLILDGFPRTVAQAKWLIDKVKSGQFKLVAIFHLNISKAAAMDRLLKRERQDDNEAAINQRFTEYEQKVLPTIGYIKQAGYEVKEINAEQSVEAVAKDIQESL